MLVGTRPDRLGTETILSNFDVEALGCVADNVALWIEDQQRVVHRPAPEGLDVDGVHRLATEVRAGEAQRSAGCARSGRRCGSRPFGGRGATARGYRRQASCCSWNRA